MASRLDFATPKAFCRAGFNRLRPGLVLPPDIDDRLYAAFEEGHRSGNPRLQQKLMRDVIGDTTWKWPWMERCAAQFVQLNMWPAQWQTKQIQPPLRWNIIPAETKLELLSITLSQFAHIAHRVAQATQPSVASIYKMTLLSSRPCEASAYLAERYRSAVEAGDLSKMPPYFPNDMVVLTTIRRIPR